MWLKGIGERCGLVRLLLVGLGLLQLGSVHWEVSAGPFPQWGQSFPFPPCRLGLLSC